MTGDSSGVKNMDANTSTKRSLITEIAVVTIAVLVVCHVLYYLRFISFINAYLSVIVAFILLYAPIIVLWLRRRRVVFFEYNLKQFVRSLKIFLVVSLIVFPAFFLCAHFWQTIVMGYSKFKLASFPGIGRVIFYQLLLIALPEEFYFRGYVQPAFNAVFKLRWNVFGVQLGWSWILTAAVFAVAHSIITYQWWHFAIFFPGLLFGWLKERTGALTAPILFHAAANILMNLFARSYI